MKLIKKFFILFLLASCAIPVIAQNTPPAIFTSSNQGLPSSPPISATNCATLLNCIIVNGMTGQGTCGMVINGSGVTTLSVTIAAGLTNNQGAGYSVNPSLTDQTGTAVTNPVSVSGTNVQVSFWFTCSGFNQLAMTATGGGSATWYFYATPGTNTYANRGKIILATACPSAPQCVALTTQSPSPDPSPFQTVAPQNGGVGNWEIGGYGQLTGLRFAGPAASGNIPGPLDGLAASWTIRGCDLGQVGYDNLCFFGPYNGGSNPFAGCTQNGGAATIGCAGFIFGPPSSNGHSYDLQIGGPGGSGFSSSHGTLDLANNNTANAAGGGAVLSGGAQNQCSGGQDQTVLPLNNVFLLICPFNGTNSTWVGEWDNSGNSAVRGSITSDNLGPIYQPVPFGLAGKAVTVSATSSPMPIASAGEIFVQTTNTTGAINIGGNAGTTPSSVRLDWNEALANAASFSQPINFNQPTGGYCNCVIIFPTQQTAAQATAGATVGSGSTYINGGYFSFQLAAIPSPNPSVTGPGGWGLNAATGPLNAYIDVDKGQSWAVNGNIMNWEFNNQGFWATPVQVARSGLIKDTGGGGFQAAVMATPPAPTVTCAPGGANASIQYFVKENYVAFSGTGASSPESTVTCAANTFLVANQSTPNPNSVIVATGWTVSASLTTGTENQQTQGTSPASGINIPFTTTSWTSTANLAGASGAPSVDSTLSCWGDSAGTQMKLCPEGTSTFNNPLQANANVVPGTTVASSVGPVYPMTGNVAISTTYHCVWGTVTASSSVATFAWNVNEAFAVAGNWTLDIFDKTTSTPIVTALSSLTTTGFHVSTTGASDVVYAQVCGL